MRRLGVSRWSRPEGDVFLGPPPVDAIPRRELTPEQKLEMSAREEERRHETLFAATSVRPRLRSDREAFRAENVVPHARRVPEHDSGGEEA
jgi:hypothetical protein